MRSVLAAAAIVNTVQKGMQEREFLLAGEKHPLNGRRDRRIPASLAPSAGMHVMGTDHICAPGGYGFP